MAGDELNKVELPAIEQLQSLGWTYVKANLPDTLTRHIFQRSGSRKRLSKNIKRNNPWIVNRTSKVRKDLQNQYTNLIEANQSIWTTLNECVSVMQDLGKGNKVKLFTSSILKTQRTTSSFALTSSRSQGLTRTSSLILSCS